MTVAEVIKIFNDWDGYFIGHGTGDVTEAFDMAIRSLEAWEKVKEEIKDNRDDWIKGLDPEWHTYDRCIAIIDKHLRGVTKCK
jgi:hypothetical protein